MSDSHERCDSKEQIQQELAALGEAPASAEERRAAARLAEALEAPAGEADPSLQKADDLPAVVGLLRAVARTEGLQPPGGPRDPVDAAALDQGATARALSALLPGSTEKAAEIPGSAPETDAPETDALRADAIEAKAPETDAPVTGPVSPSALRAASTLGDQVDRLLAGLPAPDILPQTVDEPLWWAGLLRAQLHATPLSPHRLETILDDVLRAEEAPARLAPRSPEPCLPARRQRYGRARVLGTVTAVAALAASLVGLMIWWPGMQERPPAPPAALLSRSSRDVLPRAFPPAQSPTDRIDIVYQDRLQAFRAARLGAWPGWRSCTGQRCCQSQASPALAGVAPWRLLPGGGP